MAASKWLTVIFLDNPLVIMDLSLIILDSNSSDINWIKILI